MKSHSAVPDLPYRALGDSIRDARAHADRAVHHGMAGAYRNIGRLIVVEEPACRNRAGYGTDFRRDPGARLTGEYSRGVSVANFRNILWFFLVFPINPTTEIPYDETGCTVWS